MCMKHLISEMGKRNRDFTSEVLTDMAWAKEIDTPSGNTGKFEKALRRGLLSLTLALRRSEFKKECRDQLRKFEWGLGILEVVHDFEREGELVNAGYCPANVMFGHVIEPEKPDEKRINDPVVRAVARYMGWVIKNDVLTSSDLGDYYREIVGDLQNTVQKHLS